MSNVLDDEKPLQDSIIWELQKSYYDNINIKCWSDGIVPNFVTSNCYIAHQYARGILTFIRSYYARYYLIIIIFYLLIALKLIKHSQYIL